MIRSIATLPDQIVHSVYCVDDDVAMLSGILQCLAGSAEFSVVGTAPDLRTAMLGIERQRPDLLLVDLGLPDGDGSALIHHARARGLARSILVLTVFGAESHVLTAIEAGADGYLLKGLNAEDLLEACRRAVAGEAPISPAIARHLLLRLRAPAARPADGATAVDELSSREHQVLRLVAQGFVAEEVSGRLEISVHTVRTHIRNIYGKLRVSRRVQAVAEAHRRGLL